MSGAAVTVRQQLAEFFSRNGLPAVYPDQDVAVVAIDYVNYTPGEECVTLYSLRSGVGPADPLWSAMVTFAEDKRLEEVYIDHYGGGAGPPTESVAPPAIFLPEYRCLVEFFPWDWKLPSLVRATEPKEMAALFGEVGVHASNGRSASFPEVKVLRYHPHKWCVLLYRMESPESKGPKEVVGKVYLEGPRAGRLWDTLSALHPQATASGVAIPKPLALVKGWNLLLMERMAGTSMAPVLEEARTEGQAREATRLAATTLATLHSLRFQSQEVRSLPGDLRKLRKRAAGLHLAAPLLAEAVGALLDRIEPLALRSTLAAPCLIHGDYMPSQLLMDGGQVGVLDWDGACLGDPATDVGNFMAKLHSEALRTGQDHLRQLAPHFLAEYQARLPGHGLAERARLYQIIILVRKAIHGFRVSPYSYASEGRSSLPALLLQEATSCLARL